MDRVFIDTGALIAVIAELDANHEKASIVFRRLVEDRVPLLITNHIIDETCTWFLREPSLGHSAAVSFGNYINAMFSPATYNDLARGTVSDSRVLLYSSAEIEREAWRIFEKYNTTGFSFTDCTSFAAMSLLSIRSAFAFDKHFDMMGFIRL